MFQLIVAVISIALVAALALASIFYGGAAFTRSQIKAQVTTMINQAQQLSGAHTLYKTDKGGVTTNSVAELVSKEYLASAPVAPTKITSGTWSISNANGEVSVGLLSNTAQAVKDLVDDNGTGGVKTDLSAFYFPL